MLISGKILKCPLEMNAPHNYTTMIVKQKFHSSKYMGCQMLKYPKIWNELSCLIIRYHNDSVSMILKYKFSFVYIITTIAIFQKEK